MTPKGKEKEIEESKDSELTFQKVVLVAGAGALVGAIIGGIIGASLGGILGGTIGSYAEESRRKEKKRKE